MSSAVFVSAQLQEANEFHNLAIKCAKDAISHAKTCGECLIKFKANCKHGQFERMIEEQGAMHMRCAQQYMTIARHWEAIVEQTGPNKAASISIAEGLKRIRAMREVYYPEPKEEKEPVDGTTECPHGGEHEYDEEACVHCHDPRPLGAADEGSEGSEAGDQRRVDAADGEAAQAFRDAEAAYGGLTRLLDRLQKLAPYPDKEGIQVALNMSYENFRKWKGKFFANKRWEKK